MTITSDRVKELIGNREVHEYDVETEMEILRRLDDLLEAADVFWDVGAHAGIYSIVAAQVHPDLQIYSFEASEVTREEILNVNVEPFKNVKIVPYALTNEPGTVSFQESGIGQTNNSLLSTTVEPDEHEIIEIEAHSATSAIKELDIPAPDFVKLDVEGAEHRVLQGFDQDLHDGLDLLLVELHHIYTEDTETIPFLEETGFDVTVISSREIDDERQMELVQAVPE